MTNSIQNLGPIARNKISDEVVRRLEAAIEDGTFPPGKSLPPERELMQLFGVGRPSIREALYALERIGLVRLGVGERPQVIEPSPKHLLNELGRTARHLLEQPDGVKHFEQGRLFLELSLVRYAVQHASEADLQRLSAALKQNAEARHDPRRFFATDVAFHRVLAELPRNPIFIAMYDAIVEWLIAQRPPMQDPKVQCEASFVGHQRIYEAIERREILAAIEAMESHLAEANRHYV